MKNRKLNYENPIKIADGIFWVGKFEEKQNLHANPYFIIEGEEAVLIDGGSRGDFSSVMLKVLQTGVNINNIKKLIYQHFDPDLCGSITNFENVIDNKDLKILSHKANNTFLKFYGTKLKLECIEDYEFRYTFLTGRTLKFFRTPYSHATGAFITFDEQTGTLFTSDIFGSFSKYWDLYLKLDERCYDCNVYNSCEDKLECPVWKIVEFHKHVMTSKKALNFALDIIDKLPVKRIAPQHGSIIEGEKGIKRIIKALREEEKIGIDLFCKDDKR